MLESSQTVRLSIIEKAEEPPTQSGSPVPCQSRGTTLKLPNGTDWYPRSMAGARSVAYFMCGRFMGKANDG